KELSCDGRRRRSQLSFEWLGPNSLAFNDLRAGHGTLQRIGNRTTLLSSLAGVKPVDPPPQVSHPGSWRNLRPHYVRWLRHHGEESAGDCTPPRTIRPSVSRN